MDERERLEQIETSLESLRRNASPSPFRESLERIATGAPLWWPVLKLQQWWLARTLDKHGERSFATKRRHDQWRHVDLAYRYGRFVSPQLHSALDRYSHDGISDRDLRLLVVNRILRSDGNLKISLFKERTLFLVGWLYVALCVTGFALTTALIWFSPMGIGTKLFFTIGPVAVFIVGSYSISCYAIKPFPLVRKLSAI